jgi:prepilin-type N-terminal cleavage/methylation domain-containing protein/prepilin-type processing-associated H-X9-DG protein
MRRGLPLVADQVGNMLHTLAFRLPGVRELVRGELEMWRDIRKGFTLIELLVVIAIIAILAAILFPAFIQAKAKGMQASCMSNGKQMAMAMFAYTQDSGDTFPRGCITTRVKGQYTYFFWADAIDRYVKNKKIRECPALGTVKLNGYPWAQLGVGVGANVAICNSEMGAGLPLTVKVSMIRACTRTVMFADGAYVDTTNPNARYGHWAVTGHPNETSYLNQVGWPDSYIAFRHAGRANVVFVDGHAVAMTEGQLMPNKTLPVTDPRYSLWDYN